MRALFGGDTISFVEERLLDARRHLRSLWCGQLAVAPLESDPDRAWTLDGGREDALCEDIIWSALQALPCDFSFVSEDGGQRRSGGGISFLVDPLDGTHNALAGYPAYTSSVAMYVGGRYTFGWVYDLSRDLVYTAAEGQGAYLQTPLIVERLRTKTTASIDDMVVSFLRPNHDRGRQVLGDLLWKAGKVRLSSCSSLELCLVSGGVLDAFVDVAVPGHERSCDIAAAALILREAGGFLCAADGAPRVILAPSMEATTDYGSLLAFGSRELATAIVDRFVGGSP